jgi:hypothetical protein
MGSSWHINGKQFRITRIAKITTKITIVIGTKSTAKSKSIIVVTYAQLWL